MKIRTFLVEDNATIRENLVGFLEDLAEVENLGFAEAEKPAVGWLQAPDHEWDLVIVDMFLREGSGLGVLQSIAHRPPGRRAVVLSNYATPEIRRRCMSLGADAVFDKSSEVDALVEYCLALQSPGHGPH
jgi:DNA-binding NarL/FixJ family response regulator